MVDTADTAAAALERADEAMASFQLDAAVAHLSTAIRLHTDAGEPCQAAMACARLGNLYANFLGNLSAARAWFARADRLVADVEPCLEQGWVAVAAMGCDVDDPAALQARAELALERARRFGDVNLETKALADGGLAHVQVGRVTAGMAMLDEAMALACGTADDADAAGRSVCSFFTACYYAGDFERAATWAVSLRRRGLIGAAPGAQIFLSNHCDSVQASLLCELGRWTEAEALLERAIADFEAAMPASSWHPAIALADLRVRQGRLADAEILLLGKDAHLQALLPTARLHLERGDLDLARATARRGLRAVADDRLRAVELLAVLAEADLAAGDAAAAAATAAELRSRAAVLELPALRARAAAVEADVLAANGDIAAAIVTLEGGVDGVAAGSTPWLQLTLLLQLARLRDAAGDRAGALVEAKAATALLVDLDVVLPARDRQLLEHLGLAASDADAVALAPAAVATLVRDGRWWEVTRGATCVRLPDTKGMRYLAELLANPGVERHALDLVDRVEGVATGPGAVDRRHLGDAGEVLDGQARTAYRRRIEALRAELDDALAAGDEAGLEARQAELDALVTQLAQAFGLGDRSRRASSAAERARLNVTRALRAATAKLDEALPGAGLAVDRRLRTGLYCEYAPDADDGERWTVDSGSFSRG